MYQAKLMYQEGIIVHPNQVIYQDYYDYGFRCPWCGEDVILTSGSRAPHFAHKEKTQKSKSCPGRFSQPASSPL